MSLDTKRAVDALNRLLETELAGVVRYTHYSFLVFGFGRIPIVSWLRAQADESLLHVAERRGLLERRKRRQQIVNVRQREAPQDAGTRADRLNGAVLQVVEESRRAHVVTVHREKSGRRYGADRCERD